MRSNLITLPPFHNGSILLGASSLSLVTTYPLMKRVTYWPQAVLGTSSHSPPQRKTNTPSPSPRTDSPQLASTRPNNTRFQVLRSIGVRSSAGPPYPAPSTGPSPGRYTP